MEDDFDLEAFAAEADRDLRERLNAGDPETRRQLLEWCQGAADEIVRFVPDGRMRLAGPDEADSHDLAVADWTYQVLDGDQILVQFRADGTWTARDGRTGSWFGILEGSPQSIGGSIARHLGLARQPRRRPQPADPGRWQSRYRRGHDENATATSRDPDDPDAQIPLF